MRSRDYCLSFFQVIPAISYSVRTPSDFLESLWCAFAPLQWEKRHQYPTIHAAEIKHAFQVR
jgi:hypothetical protein